MKHLGDITKINWFQVEPVDVVTGGSPCQDLSVAGKRAGLAGERSGLFMEQIRCVKELRQADVQRGRTGEFIRPRYMVWENVPGAFSSGTTKGADFAAVIEEIIKVAEPNAAVSVCVPDRGWPKSGCYYAADGSWSIAYRVHDAQYWGVPQRRKRIALLADFGGLSAAGILFDPKLRRETGGRNQNEVVGDFGAESGREVQTERKGLSGHFEPSRTEREEAAGAAVRCACGAEPVVYNGENITSPLNKTDVKPGDPCHTLGTDTRNYVVKPIICLNDQGGAVMSVSENVAGCLRSQEHGHQPIVMGFSAGQGSKAGGIGL